ncbi:MAG: C40 family peptidase [Gaiellaceae bacterium]
MSLRPRRLLPSLALATGVAAAVVVMPFGVLGQTAPESAVAAAIVPRQSEGRAPRNAPTFVSSGERAARIALRAVGVPYRWGGESPASGFDCSGLVRWAYGRIGIDLPHSSYALYGEGRRVSRSRMEAGDVLFFSGLGHVGLYLGRGRMVHAPYSGKDVEVVRLGRSSYGRRLVGARRVAAA